MPTSPIRVVAVSGSTRRPSRSHALAQAVGAAVAERLEFDFEHYDLIDAGPGLGAAFSRDQLSSEALAVIEAVESADALIAVSPVYKGSYAGLFKHLFDFVAPESLANKPVVVGATGGGHRHGLVVEHQMRPLFGFFSALTVPTSVYASDHEIEQGKIVDFGVNERVDQAAAQLASLLLSRRIAAPSVANTTQFAVNAA